MPAHMMRWHLPFWWLLLPALTCLILSPLLSRNNLELSESDTSSFIQRKIDVSVEGGSPKRPQGLFEDYQGLFEVSSAHPSDEAVAQNVWDSTEEADKKQATAKASAKAIENAEAAKADLLKQFRPFRRFSRFVPTLGAPIHEVNGFKHFLLSAYAEEWYVAIGILVIFLAVQYVMVDWPSRHKHHGFALLIWLCMGAACNFLVWWRWGGKDAAVWCTGYMLELTFSLENVFVFHIVVRAFRIPRKQAQKALNVVVVCQIVFQLVFFMGLAFTIRSCQGLPYILGVWLIYVGYQAGFEAAHYEVDFKDTWVYAASKYILGSRLSTRYTKNDVALVNFSGEKGLSVTLLLLATVCLVAVDFCLEVDVVLTKIEELQSHYLAFTSSAAAAFTVPELFFLCRDVFSRFYLLKYGISFLLVFFGAQLLFQQYIMIPTIMEIIITISSMIVCVVVSAFIPQKASDLDADVEEPDEMASDGESATCGENMPSPNLTFTLAPS